MIIGNSALLSGHRFQYTIKYYIKSYMTRIDKQFLNTIAVT